MHTFALPSWPEVWIVEMTGVEENRHTDWHILKTAQRMLLLRAIGMGYIGQ